MHVILIFGERSLFLGKLRRSQKTASPGHKNDFLLRKNVFSFSKQFPPFPSLFFFSFAKTYFPFPNNFSIFLLQKKYFPFHISNIFLLFLLRSSSPLQTSIFLLQIFKSQTFFCRPVISTAVSKSSHSFHLQSTISILFQR